ncbi:hypothetical protein BGZ98_006149 [Dissophora globulifera]|nr:hypothetical protein BGZ98_006149 [Dissophora globulifera]
MNPIDNKVDRRGVQPNNSYLVDFEPTSPRFMQTSFDHEVPMTTESLFGDQIFNVGRSQPRHSIDGPLFSELCYLPAVPVSPMHQQQPPHHQGHQQLLQQQRPVVANLSQLVSQQRLDWNLPMHQKENIFQTEVHLQPLFEQQIPHTQEQQLYQQQQRQDGQDFLQNRAHQHALRQQPLPIVLPPDYSAIFLDMASFLASPQLPQRPQLLQQQQQQYSVSEGDLPLTNGSPSYRSYEQLSSPEVLSPISDYSVLDMDEDTLLTSTSAPPTVKISTECEAMALEILNICGSSNTSVVPKGSRSIFITQQPVEKMNLLSPLSTKTMSLTLTVPPPSRRECDTLLDAVSDTEMLIQIDNSLPKSKRTRRPTMGEAKNKVNIKLPCPKKDCKVLCSSRPSLDRHVYSHRWRGIYVPVRCEACNTSVSNEYSVQRHIQRSQPNSLCRRMRVYSVMKSEIEVEATVRFYPKRPHGKKTIPVDLAEVWAKYVSEP